MSRRPAGGNTYCRGYGGLGIKQGNIIRADSGGRDGKTKTSISLRAFLLNNFGWEEKSRNTKGRKVNEQTLPPSAGVQKTCVQLFGAPSFAFTKKPSMKRKGGRATTHNKSETHYKAKYITKRDLLMKTKMKCTICVEGARIRC